MAFFSIILEIGILIALLFKDNPVIKDASKKSESALEKSIEVNHRLDLLEEKLKNK
tara:strand:+ start:132 stop:299 length:168 start_codon:yes stop_codon:yes gene_type:complete